MRIITKKKTHLPTIIYQLLFKIAPSNMPIEQEHSRQTSASKYVNQTFIIELEFKLRISHFTGFHSLRSQLHKQDKHQNLSSNINKTVKTIEKKLFCLYNSNMTCAFASLINFKIMQAKEMKQTNVYIVRLLQYCILSMKYFNLTFAIFRFAMKQIVISFAPINPRVRFDLRHSHSSGKFGILHIHLFRSDSQIIFDIPFQSLEKININSRTQFSPDSFVIFPQNI